MVEDVVVHVLSCSGPSVCDGRVEKSGGLQLMLAEIVRRVGRSEVAEPPMRVEPGAFANHLYVPARADKR